MVWITLGCEFDENERQWVRHYSKMPRFQMQAAQAKSFLGYKSLLNIESLPHKTVRATSIACCIGHRHNHDVFSLQKMMESGMNIAKLETTTFKNHSKIIQNIRQAAKNYSERLGEHFPIGIAIDTAGSTIRTGFIEGGEEKEVVLVTGNSIKLTSDTAYMYKCTTYVIFIDFESIFASIMPEQIIFIDEGTIKLTCHSIAGVFITCKIDVGGTLGSQKTVNLPNIKLNLPVISEYDQAIMDFAIKEKIDFLFCAFISNASSIIEIRETLGNKGKNIKLISKIESREGVKNLAGIIEVSDGILIGRGDLAMEVTLPKLFIVQKHIAAMCNKVGCPVVVARELLESMQNKALPTRAEISDVANAIEDGADMLMLSKDTMFGDHPNTVINIASQVCKEAEAALWRFSYDDWDFFSNEERDVDNTLAETVVNASITVGAAVIMAITENGKTAQLLSKYRPRCPILAVTRNIRVVRQCNMYRSIIPFLCEVPARVDAHKDIDVQVSAAIKFGRKRDFIHSNDPIIVFVGDIENNVYKNSMRILYADEHLEIKDNVLYVK